MQFILTPAAILTAVLIFLVRVLSITMDTLRFMLTMRGKQGIAWMLGFIESVLYVVTVGVVLRDLSNVLNVVGYAAGFATGNVVGMLIEDRMALGYLHLTIYSSMRGAAIAEALRKDGYGVTEISGRGKDGTVTVLHCSVLRKKVDSVETIVLEEDPSAFITTSDVRQVRRGFWRA